MQPPRPDNVQSFLILECLLLSERLQVAAFPELNNDAEAVVQVTDTNSAHLAWVLDYLNQCPSSMTCGAVA